MYNLINFCTQPQILVLLFENLDLFEKTVIYILPHEGLLLTPLTIPIFNHFALHIILFILFSLRILLLLLLLVDLLQLCAVRFLSSF